MLSYRHNGEERAALFLKIDFNSGEPIIRQAVAQVKVMLVDGTLRPGDRLPSIRELSRQLKINPTTVTRIYNELEHEGILVLRQGQGAFISESPLPFSKREAKKFLQKPAQTLLVEGLRRNLTYEEVEEVLRAEYEKIQQEKSCAKL